MEIKKLIEIKDRYGKVLFNHKSIKNTMQETLKYASFKEISLINADFSNQNLSQINFFNLNLQEANFSYSDISGSDFSFCNLEKAEFTKTKGLAANFTGANLIKAEFYCCDFSRTNFSRAVCEGVSWKGTNLKSCDFSQSNQFQANFMNANLESADWQNCNLIETNLSEANNIPANYFLDCSKDLLYIFTYLKKYKQNIITLLNNYDSGANLHFFKELTLLCNESLPVIPYYQQGFHNLSEQFLWQIKSFKIESSKSFIFHAKKILEKAE